MDMGDEFEYVDEINMEKHQSFKELLDGQSNDDPVSAAVTLVVGSARHGVVTLCARVAHILKENVKLQQRVTGLEKQVIALESSSSGTVSVNDSYSVQCQPTNQHNSQESPVTQRCDSAPASFIATGLKFLRTECQNNVLSGQACGLDHTKRNLNCHSGCKSGKRECRTSSISVPEASSGSESVPKILNSVESKDCFIRGCGQASTRSLNIRQSLPPSSFVRRKYSTISLRRVRRSAVERQKSSSICSSNSINSYISYATSEEPHRSSTNSSCIITVAEIHTPPERSLSLESTGEAVKLLARTLTSVLQGEVTDEESLSNELSGVDAEANDLETSKPSKSQEFCLPHPLAGCECMICLRLISDPTCQLYALTTDGGSLLPPGSRVLVEGERVGTILYMGHEKYSVKGRSPNSPGSVGTSVAQEENVRPVGVTVKLWAPDQGEIFVPLSGVICQLDDELDLHRKESWSSSEYEYVDEDSDEEHVATIPDCSPEHLQLEADVSRSLRYPTELSYKEKGLHDITSGVCESFDEDRKSAVENYFIRSPSVSSCSSVDSHSLGDLSVYGLECEECDVEFSKAEVFQDNPTKICLNFVPRSFNETEEDCDSRDKLNTTFISKTAGSGTVHKGGVSGDYNESLYDTCDSAISLSFTRRLPYSEDNSEPSSLTDTGRESPHFGDTWDSGCSVGRTRCRSDSSGHFSDMEPDNRLGITFTKSLGEALNCVWEKRYFQKHFALETHAIENEKKNTLDKVSLSTKLFKKGQSRQESFQGYHNSLKEFTSSMSTNYEISGDNQGQSEV